MNQVQSVFALLAALSVFTLLGAGPVVGLLPRDLRRYCLFVAPGVGYAVFALFSIWLSALTGAATLTANIVAGVALFLWCGGALWRRRDELRDLTQSWKLPLFFAAICAVVVFPTALWLGIDGYLGTVNPDFYQSLSFHETLYRTHSSFWANTHDLHLAGPFQEMFPDAFQARFGGVAVSVFLEQIFHLSSRAALITALMAFVACLPLALYFFTRAVLEFKEREAILSSVFVAIAAPTAMSFMHTFIGQNSALAMFPLGISLLYLTLQRRSLPLAVLTSLVLGGVFYLYVMALPYMIVPFFLAIAIMLVRSGWRSVTEILPVGFAMLGVVAVIFLSVYPVTAQFIRDLFDLLGNMTQSQYYADFLTEEVMQYATGMTTYPLSQSRYYWSVSHQAPMVLISVSFILAGFYFVTLRQWMKTASKEASSLVIAMLAVTIAVWVKYTFSMRYGYASFKMSAWLQFLFVPFLAWGIVHGLGLLRAEKGGLLKKMPVYGALFFLAGIYPVFNLMSDVDYDLKSMGHDYYHGSIINTYGVSGNPEYDGLSAEFAKLIPEGKTVAVGFGDSLENFWISYYLDRAKLKPVILTHEEIPFEDAFLPEVGDRSYVDSMGHVQHDNQKYFNGGEADYYVLPNQGNMNIEVVLNQPRGEPLWQSDTLRLYKKDDIRDIVVTGRGFYRVEHMDTLPLSWWWPEAFRWSAQGGEVYQFNPSAPGTPYHLEFSVMAGLGQATGERTIELWHNGKLFDEIKLHGVGRVITKDYRADPGINRIVMRVKEKSVLVARKGGLWNRDLPRRATPINALFTDIRVVHGQEPSDRVFPKNEWVEPKEQFAKYAAFNGFDVDGWVRDQAEFTVAGMKGVDKLQMHLLVPGNLGFKFPTTVQFVVNGVKTEKTFDYPKEFDVEIPVLANPNDADIRVQIIPAEARHISDGMEQREVLQSVRLSAVKFTTKE